MCEVDNQGRCAKHNFVQVKRLSRSGDWRSLLEVCPLCAMDTGGASGSDSMSLVPFVSSNEEKKLKVSFTGVEVRKDYLFTPPSSNPVIDASDRSVISASSAQSGHSYAPRPALKSPKYKACPKKMKEQSNVEVTTMSMDLDIHEDSESEDESPQQQNSSPFTETPTKRTPPPPPRRQSKHKEEKSKVNPRVIGQSPVRSSLRSSINSTNETPTTKQIRPDPEEFKHNSIVCKEIRASPESHFSDCLGPFIMTRDVSDDVSAITFMGSVYTNTQSNFNVTLVPFQEMDEEPQDNPKDFDFDNDDAEEDVRTSTNTYDSKGRCVKHPHVRLRKKKFLGRGWKTLMSACPDCCVEELRRIKSESSMKKSNDAQKSMVEQVPARKMALPRNSIKDKESDDTASLSTSSQGSINVDHLSVVKKEDKDGIFVKNMIWTDLKGRRGSYTGEVDSQFIPNGQGSMQYEDATMRKGEWKNGGHKSGGRSRSKASERSSRSRSVSVRPGARSRSTSVTPHTRARSSSRSRYE